MSRRRRSLQDRWRSCSPLLLLVILASLRASSCAFSPHGGVFLSALRRRHIDSGRYYGLRLTDGLLGAHPQEQDEASTLEFFHPETNCQVVLLGCLHGSLSSSANVQRVLSEESTDVVVLELCASRFTDMRRELENNEGEEQQQGQSSQQESLISWWMSFASVIAKTIRRRGLQTGVATAILGGASGLQTALSGFEPGLEFKTALELSSSIENCDIILADRTVDETLQRFGSLPSVSYNMLREWIDRRGNWQDTFGREARALHSAVLGDDTYSPNQVNMVNFLTRDNSVLQDLIRLTLVPLIFAQLVLSITNFVFGALEENGAVLSTLAPTINPSSVLMDMASTFSVTDIVAIGSNVVSDVMTSAVLLGLVYVTLALPATRLILCERDIQLSNGIRAACRLAASKHKAFSNAGSSSHKKNGGRVVAVLGLLHVNGVAKRLLTQDDQNLVES